MCNLSETCIEMKIEKKNFFSYKKIFRKKILIKKFPSSGGRVGRPVHQVFGSWRWVLRITFHFWMIIMAPLEVSWLAPMCVPIEMQFVRQKHEMVTSWSVSIQIGQTIPRFSTSFWAQASRNGPKLFMKIFLNDFFLSRYQRPIHICSGTPYLQRNKQFDVR